MAKTATGRVLTEEHRLMQLGIRARAIRDLSLLWPMWSGADPATHEAFVTALATIVDTNRRQAALIAARYYRAFRRAEGIAGAVDVVLAESLPAEVLRASLAATGQAGRARALAAGMKETQAAANGFARLSGSLGRHVLNGGRETLMDTIRADPAAIGWARVTDGSPCGFCAMLASRGPDYKSKRTAGFHAHDHCGCHAEPVMGGRGAYEWPGNARQLRAQWDDATKGYSGVDALNAYRRSLAKT